MTQTTTHPAQTTHNNKPLKPIKGGVGSTSCKPRGHSPSPPLPHPHSLPSPALYIHLGRNLTFLRWPDFGYLDVGGFTELAAMVVANRTAVLATVGVGRPGNYQDGSLSVVELGCIFVPPETVTRDGEAEMWW
jgi:hypothetical protein